MPFKTKHFHIFSLCALTLLCAPFAHAQNDAPVAVPASKGDVVEIPAASNEQVPPPGMSGVNILPAKSLSTDQLSVIDPEEPTHPELRLTPDKSEIVRLDAEAGTVIVGNPNHISVMADNTRTLIVVPKMPGATYFTVMDNKGNVIMQRHVIVASPKEKYVRIRKSCVTAEDPNCQTTQVYYCPDMCHEIITSTGGDESGSAAAATTSAGEASAKVIEDLKEGQDVQNDETDTPVE